MRRSRSAVVVVTLALGAALDPGAQASSLAVPAAASSVDFELPDEASVPSPVVTVAEPPRLRTLADDPPTDARTPKPTAAEWKTAPAVALSRQNADCKAQREREWLRITCPVHALAAMDLLAGPSEGVSFERAVKGPDQALVLPLRRGDRRVLQMVSVSWSKYSMDYDTVYAISEDWLEGAAGPTVGVD